MVYNHTLLEKAGSRQKILLIEFEKQAIIVRDREAGLWHREGLSCRLAKDLLKKQDRTIQERIDDLEPSVLRLEADAKAVGTKLTGSARAKLNELYELKRALYGE